MTTKPDRKHQRQNCLRVCVPCKRIVSRAFRPSPRPLPHLGLYVALSAPSCSVPRNPGISRTIPGVRAAARAATQGAYLRRLHHPATLGVPRDTVRPQLTITTSLLVWHMSSSHHDTYQGRTVTRGTRCVALRLTTYARITFLCVPGAHAVTKRLLTPALTRQDRARERKPRTEHHIKPLLAGTYVETTPRGLGRVERDC